MKHLTWQHSISPLVVSILLVMGASAAEATSPTATSTAATTITQSGATLNGTVTANGATTTVIFEWGLSALYGNSGGPAPLPGSASGAPVAWPIGGLSCNTLYHFHITANNGDGGVIDGGDLTFTTSGCPAGTPSASTSAATAVTQTTATLNGTASANGTTTAVGFLYGPTTLYGVGIGAGQSPLPGSGSGVAISVTTSFQVSCNTLYHFRAFANNGIGGVQYGDDLTFTTSACAPLAPTSAIPTLSDIALLILAALIAALSFGMLRARSGHS